MELSFKNVALLMLVAGGIYAWYSGLFEGFLGGFSGQLSSGGSAAQQVED